MKEELEVDAKPNNLENKRDEVRAPTTDYQELK